LIVSRSRYSYGAPIAPGATQRPEVQEDTGLARRCAAALLEQKIRQGADRLAAGPLWQDHNLVFASTVGAPLDDHNVRRQFRKITESAGLGSTWVPRELRHTFVAASSERSCTRRIIRQFA
jgi:site-specific recombinase XerC